jgi:methylase of polypeptide subunit release factors
LKLKVCDVACGSGHILLSAARRIALAVARVLTDEEQPNPLSIRKAMKDVVRNCIYGVDKNPLAVELCKIALWLEAYNPGEPLNFLDHHIKCGDAIVGLAHRSELEKGIADEAFKTLAVDDKDIAKTWRDKNVKERKERIAKSLQLKAEFEKSTENSVQEAMAEYKTFNQLPETTPDEIERKAKAYKKFIDGKGFTFLKAMADTQVAQFFIPKTETNKDYLTTDADFRLILSGYKGWQDRKVAKATTVALEQRIFHWFIEFPEVFNEGGFDCILGNPPYLGAKYISSHYGKAFLEYLTSYFSNTGNRCDLIAYFIRRISTLIQEERFFSVITTNSISQGDTRVGALDVLLNDGYEINFANKNVKWPGQAAVDVSLMSLFSGFWRKEHIYNNKTVDKITSYLDTGENQTPFSLHVNSDIIFQGSITLGDGFVLNEEEAVRILSIDKKYSEVIFQYINGDDLVNSPKQSPSRFVINFWDYEEEQAKMYPECYQIVEAKVKPERQRWKIDDSGNEVIGEFQLRRPLPQKWWIYAEKRPKLYSNVKRLEKIIAVPLVSKYLSFSILPSNYIFSNKLSIICLDKFNIFLILQSSIHEVWSWKYSTTMGSSTLNYIPTNCFETFPIPYILESHRGQQLEAIGEAYHEHRRQLMLGMQLGLTKTYNLFHSKAITAQSINDKDKQVASLQKHLDKTANTISFDEAIEGILKLRVLHVQLDEAVLDAYGWNDIELKHDFYEVDYLPENDRVRFTIHPDARKEVLKRLLELNHKIHEEEMNAGLLGKRGKGKPNLDVSDIEIGSIVAEPKPEYKQPSNLGEITLPLFSQAPDIITEKSRVTLDFEGKILRVSPVKGAKKGDFSGSYQHISYDSPLAQILLGKKQGEKVEFEGKIYKIVMVG